MFWTVDNNNDLINEYATIEAAREAAKLLDFCMISDEDGTIIDGYMNGKKMSKKVMNEMAMYAMYGI